MADAVNPLNHPLFNPRALMEDAMSALTGGRDVGVDEKSGAYLAGSLAMVVVPGSGFGTAAKAGAARLLGGVAEELPIRIYRGTDNYLEKMIVGETDFIMSDAARIAFMEGGGSLSVAMAASQRAHAANVASWGNETLYALAHGHFGTEMAEVGARSLISFTTDPAVTARFGGSVYSTLIKPSQGIWQNLPGSTEAEVLIPHMIKVMPWPR